MLNPHTGRGKVNGSQKSFLRSTRIRTGNERITVCCLCIILKVDKEEKRTDKVQEWVYASRWIGNLETYQERIRKLNLGKAGNI